MKYRFKVIVYSSYKETYFVDAEDEDIADEMVSTNSDADSQLGYSLKPDRSEGEDFFINSIYKITKDDL